MPEFLSRGESDPESESKKGLNFVAGLRKIFDGLSWRSKRDGEHAKNDKEMIAPEIILFNQEQIHIAMERILQQLKKTRKTKGVIVCEELLQKDKNGRDNIFSLRYAVDNQAKLDDGYYALTTMSFRIEMFNGNKENTSSLKPCFILKEGIDKEWGNDHDDEERVVPVAYRQIYFHNLSQIDPLEDGLNLQGFSYTDKKYRGLGISTKIFEEVHNDDLIKDFVKRTKKHWKKYRLPEGIKEVACIFTDTTYLYGGSNRFWTTRLMERMGMERADWVKYQYHDENIFVKKTSLD